MNVYDFDGTIYDDDIYAFPEFLLEKKCHELETETLIAELM